MDFYFHFVVPNRSLIELGRSTFVTDSIRSQFSRYVSAWWEKLCRQAVSGGEIGGEMYNLAGRWWGNVSRDESIELDLDVLGYIDSNITVNRVKDGKLEKKVHLELPQTLRNVIKCKNPRCITSVEQEIVHTFRLVDREKKAYRCIYCDAEHRVK